MRLEHVRTILFVSDQRRSRDFYATLLGREAALDVPGMTEFALAPAATLGLMPETRIAEIVTPPLRHPTEAAGIPRCELYLTVDDVETSFRTAVGAGAIPVSAPALRNWGDVAGYVCDPDGHVVAFAQGTAH